MSWRWLAKYSFVDKTGKSMWGYASCKNQLDGIGRVKKRAKAEKLTLHAIWCVKLDAANPEYSLCWDDKAVQYSKKLELDVSAKSMIRTHKAGLSAKTNHTSEQNVETKPRIQLQSPDNPVPEFVLFDMVSSSFYIKQRQAPNG